jgi:hypothetical protein
MARRTAWIPPEAPAGSAERPVRPGGSEAAGPGPARPTTRRRGPDVVDLLPDVRDGLTRVERVILYELWKLEKERPGRNFASALLYGRVVEHIDIAPETMQLILARLGARKPPRDGG